MRMDPASDLIRRQDITRTLMYFGLPVTKADRESMSNAVKRFDRYRRYLKNGRTNRVAAG